MNYIHSEHFFEQSNENQTSEQDELCGLFSFFLRLNFQFFLLKEINGRPVNSKLSKLLQCIKLLN